MASPRELFPEPEPADEVATATSGKVWRKLAINSSPGFWDDVRFRNIWLEAELEAAHSFKFDSSGRLCFPVV
jgi:hypothetical protein